MGRKTKREIENKIYNDLLHKVYVEKKDPIDLYVECYNKYWSDDYTKEDEMFLDAAAVLAAEAAVKAKGYEKITVNGNPRWAK